MKSNNCKLFIVISAVIGAALIAAGAIVLFKLRGRRYES